MRMSELLLPTERQAPADAEALSHKLGVRAGLVRQLGAGLWSWLPAGWRVHQHAVQIVREEMDAIGGQELLLPVLQPRDLWRRTGRDELDEVFKLSDRKGSELVLAITHEEPITFHVGQAVRSYRDLPKILYHFQTKGRDEPRPRAGVLRTREFIMKDSYSFDRDLEGLQASYDKHVVAYDRIFDRAGLEWYRVDSDVGMMGGTGAHEYMAPCPAGENDVALAPGYAANVEVASADAQPVALPPGLDAPREVSTPGLTTIDAVAGHLGVPAGALLKAYPVVTDGGRFVLVVVRGDHRVNDIKLTNHLGEPCRPAHAEEIEQRLGPPGFIGPVGADVPVLLDRAVAEHAGAGGWIAGAGRPDLHLEGVEPGRDFAFEPADVRTVEAGDLVNGTPIRIEPAIEIGNIFKLGTRYSEPLGATYLDEHGTEQLIWMGSYGIGPARIAAASIEQTADEKGIAWPRSLAPWPVHLVGLGKAGTPEREAAEGLYAELRAAGIAVVYDDRDAGAGEKFADAELLGCPLRLTVGRRTLEDGLVEAQGRRGLASLAGVPLREGAPAAVEALLRELP
ncbi:MAG: proline--tRNA ligase [Solirubrobacteraceae bacterium]|nr:proline--tRNA ligase [Solirubrobacteraceae bacterium]